MSKAELTPYQAPQPSAGLVPTTVAEAQKFAELAAASKLLPQELQIPAAAFAVIATGLELGLSPMQALRSIHIVKGRPVLSADLIVALVKRSPECTYFRLVESTEERATYETLRKGEPEPVALSFSMSDAKRAGLVQAGGNWAKYPRNMLRHRCAAQLARVVYPDVVLGIYEESEGEEIARDVRQATATERTSRPSANPRAKAPTVAPVAPSVPAPVSVPSDTSDAVEAEYEPLETISAPEAAPGMSPGMAPETERPSALSLLSGSGFVTAAEQDFAAAKDDEAIGKVAKEITAAKLAGRLTPQEAKALFAPYRAAQARVRAVEAFAPGEEVRGE